MSGESLGSSGEFPLQSPPVLRTSLLGSWRHLMSNRRGSDISSWDLGAQPPVVEELEGLGKSRCLVKVQ